MQHEEEENFMYDYLLYKEYEESKKNEKEEHKETYQGNNPIYDTDYSKEDKKYNEKKHNIWIDLLLIYLTGGIWFIWMIVRYFREKK